MSRYYSDDPIADFERWDLDQQKLLDACYEVNGHKYCLDCSEAAAEAVLPQLIGVTMG